MKLTRRRTLGLVGSALAMPFVLRGTAHAAGLVRVGNPFRLGAGQPGGQANPALFPATGGGFLASWVNADPTLGPRAFLRYLNSTGGALSPNIAMGGAAGPSSGNPAFGAAPIAFGDGTALVLVSARRTASANADAIDIFAQRMNADREKIGGLLPVNSHLTGHQTDLFATRLETTETASIWRSTESDPAALDVRGCLVRRGGAPVAADTVFSEVPGDQIPTSIAPGRIDRWAFAYSSTQNGTRRLKLQRMRDNVREGAPILLLVSDDSHRHTAGIVRLTGGPRAPGYAAAFFGNAVVPPYPLEIRFFGADGAPQGGGTIGTSIIDPLATPAPQIAVTPAGYLVIVTQGGGVAPFRLNGWYVSPTGQRLAGPVQLYSSDDGVDPKSLVRLPSNHFAIAWTEGIGVGAENQRALVRRFRIV